MREAKQNTPCYGYTDYGSVRMAHIGCVLSITLHENISCDCQCPMES